MVFSSLNDYQFASQGILCLLSLYYYIQCLMDIVVSFFLINFITFVLNRIRDSFFAENHLLISERTFCDSIQKSCKYLLEIMTLVLSANIMGIDKMFSEEGGHL
jgi:hypothetical protein